MTDTIQRVVGREVLNGIGNPTVEVDVWLASDGFGRASVPSGASTGKHEALELRDGGQRYSGRGVLRAVENVNRTIGPRLVGMDATNQAGIDRAMIELDGTENMSRLGANAILAVSLAVANAAAATLNMPLYRCLGGPGPWRLPAPEGNVMAGGRLSANHLDFEDHLIFPALPMTFRESVRAIAEVYAHLGVLLERRFGPVRLVGGAFAPPLDTEDEALSIIIEAIGAAGYAGRLAIGLDVAANLFYQPDRDCYRTSRGDLTRNQLLDYYKELIGRYPLRQIEDPLHENDFAGFRMAKEKLGIQIVGDDLFVTNRRRLEHGIALGAANAMVFKLNQIGTLTEALAAADTARRAGYAIIASVRSGECEDVSVADVTVSIAASHMKIGAPVRGERNSKYNRLMRIEEELETGRRVP